MAAARRASRIFGPAKYWVRDGADLRADRRAGVHDEGDQNIDIAFDGMTKSAVAGRDDDLKEIGPDREMGRNSENVNHHRHPDVARAAAEKSAEESADKRDHNDDPERDRFHARGGQRNHRPERNAVNRIWSCPSNEDSSFALLDRARFSCRRFAFLAGASSSSFPRP